MINDDDDYDNPSEAFVSKFSGEMLVTTLDSFSFSFCSAKRMTSANTGKVFSHKMSLKLGMKIKEKRKWWFML